MQLHTGTKLNQRDGTGVLASGLVRGRLASAGTCFALSRHGVSLAARLNPPPKSPPVAPGQAAALCDGAASSRGRLLRSVVICSCAHMVQHRPPLLSSWAMPRAADQHSAIAQPIVRLGGGSSTVVCSALTTAQRGTAANRHVLAMDDARLGVAMAHGYVGYCLAQSAGHRCLQAVRARQHQKLPTLLSTSE